MFESTVEIHRLDKFVLDWTSAVVGEADRELTCVSLTCHTTVPIYVTLVESTSFYSIRQKQVSLVKCLVKEEENGSYIIFLHLTLHC